MRRLQIASMGIGLLLLIELVRRLGVRTLAAELLSVGWALPLILVLSGAKYALRTFAWSIALGNEGRRYSFREMYGARLGGEALGYLTSAGPFLGEPMKAQLIRARVPIEAGLAASVVEAGCYAVASGAFVAAGAAALTGSFFYLTAGGSLGATAALGWLRWRRRRRGDRLTRKRFHKLREVLSRLIAFGRERPIWLLAVFGLDVLSHGLALTEVWALMHALGIPASLGRALIIESATKIARAALFFIPGNLGAEEAGTAAIFHTLGLAPAAGVSLALIRRARAIFWSGLGLVIVLHNTWAGERNSVGCLEQSASL